MKKLDKMNFNKLRKKNELKTHVYFNTIKQ